MSIFKTSWIILKKITINSDQILTVFSKDYWKIKLVYKNKKDQKFDIWANINFEIIVKNENKIHNIKNIFIKNQVNVEKLNFSIIYEYLNILNIINIFCIENNVCYEIYEIMDFINTKEKLSENQIILAQLRIFNILWILDLNHINIEIKKVLYFVNKTKINDFSRLKLEENHLFELKNIIKNILKKN